MSLDGLLDEVKHFHANNLDIALGEQLFYGGKRVFSDVKPGSSSADNKTDKKKGKGDHNELKGAIANAKKIANNALKEGGSGNDGAVKELKKDHDTLVKKVEDLTALVNELKLELASLRQGQVQLNKPILILGDGNLSFSISLARSCPECLIIGTVFDSKESFIKKYDELILTEISKLSNIFVIFGFDATRISSHWHGKFSKVIMNFPHPGGKTNLKRCRILLSSIFKSLSTIVDDDCCFELSLAYGQPGIDKCESEWSSCLPTHKKDSWNAIYIAADEGFELVDVEEFHPGIFCGYRSSGYKNTSKGFNNKGGLCLKFRKYQRLANLSIMQYSKLERCRIGVNAPYHNYRPFYSQDLSFLLIGNVEIAENNAMQLIEKIGGGCVSSVTEIYELRSMCPYPYLPNRIYRIVYQSVVAPFGKKICQTLHEELRSIVISEIESCNLPLVLT